MTEGIFGLVGVLIGAFITAGKDIYFDWQTRLKSQEYLAIRVVTRLDDYIVGCVEVAVDTGEPDERGYYHTRCEVPEFDLDSLDVDWKSISAHLMYKILSFPSSIDAAHNKIQGVTDNQASPPEYSEFFAERRYQYAKLGFSAFALTEELRSVYKIKPRIYENWDPIKSLREKLSVFEHQREQSLLQQEAMNAEMRKFRSGD